MAFISCSADGPQDPLGSFSASLAGRGAVYYHSRNFLRVFLPLSMLKRTPAVRDQRIPPSIYLALPLILLPSLWVYTCFCWVISFCFCWIISFCFCWVISFCLCGAISFCFCWCHLLLLLWGLLLLLLLGLLLLLDHPLLRLELLIQLDRLLLLLLDLLLPRDHLLLLYLDLLLLLLWLSRSPPRSVGFCCSQGPE